MHTNSFYITLGLVVSVGIFVTLPSGKQSKDPLKTVNKHYVDFIFPNSTHFDLARHSKFKMLDKTISLKR